MSLRFKLLLIALSTLALPLAGWLFVRQMEELLRQGQEQTLIASARALARSLDALKAELPPAGDTDWAERHGTSPSGAVLVRPDGFVAWRSGGSEPDAETALRQALKSVLGLA